MRISLPGLCTLLWVAFSYQSTASATPTYWAFSAADACIFDALFQSCLPASWPTDVTGGSRTSAGTFASATTTGGTLGFDSVGPSLGEADLSTGTLKASAQMDVNNPVGFISRGLGEFGDSFITSDPSGPFDWSSGTATFSMILDGRISITDPGVLDRRLWQLSLIVYKPGTFAGPLPQDLAAVTLGRCDWRYRQSGLTESCSAISGSHSGAFDAPGGLLTQASFNFGMDFDWVAFFLAGTIPNSTGPFAADVDFAHTLRVSYDGPEGTTFASASGVFPGSSNLRAVPEPGTLVLFGTGLAGFWVARRKRHSG